ncbi:MAG: YjjG family noncanonical pyrimidine nucleotidase [Spirochaetota bacterium]
MEAKYRAVLMDADETIFDFARAEAFALDETFRAFGLDPTPEALALYDLINKELWRKFEKGEIAQAALKIRRFETLFSSLGVKAPAEAFSEAYIVNLGKGAFLLPGAEELCAYLAAKYPLVLVTNGIARVQRPRFEASPVRRHFLGIVISEEAGAAKPAPKIFRKACEVLGPLAADPRDLIMVGDSLESDIAGAAAFGMDSCWVNLKGQPLGKGILPTYEVRSLEALREIL